MMVIVEQLVEWRLAGETDVLGENLPSTTLSTTNPTWPEPGSTPGRRGGKPALNRLSYGAAHEVFTWYSVNHFYGEWYLMKDLHIFILPLQRKISVEKPPLCLTIAKLKK
jgi:hypothetical protein